MRQQAAAHQVRPQKLQPLRRWCGTGGHVGGTPAEPDSATKMPCITAGRHGKSGLVGALAAAGKTEGSRTSKAAANAHRLKKAGRQTRRRGGGGATRGCRRQRPRGRCPHLGHRLSAQLKGTVPRACQHWRQREGAQTKGSHGTASKKLAMCCHLPGVSVAAAGCVHVSMKHAPRLTRTTADAHRRTLSSKSDRHNQVRSEWASCCPGGKWGDAQAQQWRAANSQNEGGGRCTSA
jgi:hypothetical protein